MPRQLDWRATSYVRKLNGSSGIGQFHGPVRFGTLSVVTVIVVFTSQLRFYMVAGMQ